MRSSRGSLSLSCLVICLLLLLLVQLPLLWGIREQERLRDFWRGYQLRLLCGSVLQVRDSLPPGEYVFYEGLLLPGKEPVTVTGLSKDSEDGLINLLELSATAANHAGAVQRLRRLQLSFSQNQRQLGEEGWALASINLTGTEYLPEEAKYTSIEEVTVPQVSFLENIGLDNLSSKSAEINGLSNRFYYLPTNSLLTLSSTKPFYGSAVIINHSNIKIGSGSHFPDRLVLLNDKGDITLQQGVRLDKALVMSPGTVIIAKNCRINGLVIAKNIILEGTSTFTADAEVVAPFTSAAFQSLLL